MCINNLFLFYDYLSLSLECREPHISIIFIIYFLVYGARLVARVHQYLGGRDGNFNKIIQIFNEESVSPMDFTKKLQN